MPYHTVLEFTFVAFDEKWKRDLKAMAPHGYLYTAAESATLQVVKMSAVGTLETYTFRLSKGDEVLVSSSENTIFIPARCLTRKPGDETKCSES